MELRNRVEHRDSPPMLLSRSRRTECSEKILETEFYVFHLHT